MARLGRTPRTTTDGQGRKWFRTHKDYAVNKDGKLRKGCKATTSRVTIASTPQRNGRTVTKTVYRCLASGGTAGLGAAKKRKSKAKKKCVTFADGRKVCFKKKAGAKKLSRAQAKAKGFRYVVPVPGAEPLYARSASSATAMAREWGMDPTRVRAL